MSSGLFMPGCFIADPPVDPLLPVPTPTPPDGLNVIVPIVECGQANGPIR